MIPQGILETVVYCQDLDAARGFYEGLLGLQLVSAEPGRHLFFRVGRSMLLVFQPEQTRQATVKVGDQTIPPHGARGASHLALEVKSSQLEDIKTRLMAHGIMVESQIKWPGGGESVYCRDPAGNSVEFATRTLWFNEET